jgi:hypothetical protein
VAEDAGARVMLPQGITNAASFVNGSQSMVYSVFSYRIVALHGIGTTNEGILHNLAMQQAEAYSTIIGICSQATGK